MHVQTYIHTYVCTYVRTYAHIHMHAHTQAFEVIIEAHTYQGICITMHFMNHFAI